MFISPSIRSVIFSARSWSLQARRTPYTPKTTLLHLGTTELADLVYDSTSGAFNAWEWTAVLVALQALSWRVPCWWHWVKRANVLLPKRQARNKWIRTTKQGRDLYSCHRLLWKWFPFFVSSVTGTVLLSNVEGSRQHDWIHITVGVATPSWIWILYNVCILSTRTISLVGCCGTGNYHSKAQCRNRFQTNACVLGNLPHDAQFLDTVAFNNIHLTFYGDYFGMIKRLLHLFAKRFLWNCPPRLMAFFYVPTFVMWLVFANQACKTLSELDDDAFMMGIAQSSHSLKLAIIFMTLLLYCVSYGGSMTIQPLFVSLFWGIVQWTMNIATTGCNKTSSHVHCGAGRFNWLTTVPIMVRTATIYTGMACFVKIAAAYPPTAVWPRWASHTTTNASHGSVEMYSRNALESSKLISVGKSILTFNMTNAMLTQDPAMRPMTMLPNVFAWFIMATLTCDVLMWELTPVWPSAAKCGCLWPRKWKRKFK